ncbi:MAG: hypothetical protein IIX95_06780 [Clostridiales bacterium]|nr:hypothetical protein [Clostridiales bacterium]
MVTARSKSPSIIDHPEHRSYQDGVITLGEETAIEISIKNTEPHGTQDRPYSIEDENEITILAGQTVYYVIYGGSNRNFNLSGANGIKLIFAGEEKAIKDDGSLSFKIPEVDNFNRVTEVAFENTGDESVTFNLAITSDPGTSDNPFELELGKSYDEVIKKDQTIFYKWIADKTGYVVFHSASKNNSTMIYNQTSFVVTTPTNGALCDYIWANAGDEIMFYVSSTNEENFNEVSFDVNCYAGTENDPIPVYEPAKMLSLKPAQALTFVSVCDGDCEVIAFADLGIVRNLEMILAAQSVESEVSYCELDLIELFLDAIPLFDLVSIITRTSHYADIAEFRG